MSGGPGSGKTALMDEVGRVPNTRTVGGADLTGPGLRAMFLEPPPGAQTPDILVIDEIDQLKPVAVGTLRMLLIGKITAATHLQQREESTNVKVVAACNDERRVDPAIRDRFQVLRLVDLSEAERRRLLSQYLVRRKHLGAEEASEIADLVAPRSASVRDAARIATVWREDRELAVKLAANLRGASTV